MVMELIGMKAICQQVQRSEATVLIWIRDMDFPAKKIGGIWESSTEAIRKWKEKIFNGEIEVEKQAPKKSVSSGKTRKKQKRSI